MKDAAPPKSHATRSNSNTPTRPQLTPPMISRISASLSHITKSTSFRQPPVKILVRFSRLHRVSFPTGSGNYTPAGGRNRKFRENSTKSCVDTTYFFIRNMDFTSCFLCSSTKNVEKTCFILFSLDGVRAIVYNKNSDNKTPCKRSGCGLIKSLLFLFFHKRLSLVLLSPFFCSIFCFCPFLFGKRVFFYPS